MTPRRPRRKTFQRGLRAADILAPTPRRFPHDQDWINSGALSFLAEASDLLSGQLDEDQVASLAGQMMVPRLADWCAVWLDDEDGRPDRGAADRAARGTGALATPRLARVWHTSENRMEELRKILEKDPPQPTDAARSAAVPVPWPFESLGGDPAGAALAYRLSAGGRAVGTLLIGRAGLTRFPDEVTGLVEDFARRVALAVSAARRYARQATISRILQRGLLPSAVAQIPGIESALVYEPRDAGGPGGDFYDVFPAGDGRWCFALGDVQGKGPEAAVVIGLARPWLRLLAREGYQVAEVLDRLNRLLLDDATEAADAAARALAAAGGQGLTSEGAPRFLSLLYGELVPTGDGMRCTLASAGHPLPLLLRPDGLVGAAAEPQVLLGVVDDPGYTSESLVLRRRRHPPVRHGRGDGAQGRAPPVRRRRRPLPRPRRLHGTHRTPARRADQTPGPRVLGEPAGRRPRPPGPPGAVTPGAATGRTTSRLRDNGVHAFRTPRR